MIKLGFMSSQRKIIKFNIEGKIIKYSDDMWTEIQIMPLDKELVERLAKSEKTNLRMMADLIAEANTGKDLEQYNKCKTEEDLKEMVIKDCLLKGLRLIK